MIRNHLIALGARRSRLASDAQSEREAIARAIGPADGAASMVASLLAAARRVAGEARHHPALVVAGVALLVALRPLRALAWVARGWSLWRLYRGAQRWWRLFEGLTGAPPATRR